MPLRTLLCAALLAIAACRVEPERPQLVVTARDGALELDNRSGRQIFFQVMESEFAQRARFAPCVSGPECEACRANSTVRIRYADLSGYAPGAREAVVFWWFAVNNADGTSAPDTIRSVVVPL